MILLLLSIVFLDKRKWMKTSSNEGSLTNLYFRRSLTTWVFTHTLSDFTESLMVSSHVLLDPSICFVEVDVYMKKHS